MPELNSKLSGKPSCGPARDGSGWATMLRSYSRAISDSASLASAGLSAMLRPPCERPVCRTAISNWSSRRAAWSSSVLYWVASAKYAADAPTTIDGLIG